MGRNFVTNDLIERNGSASRHLCYTVSGYIEHVGSAQLSSVLEMHQGREGTLLAYTKAFMRT